MCKCNTIGCKNPVSFKITLLWGEKGSVVYSCKEHKPGRLAHLSVEDLTDKNYLFQPIGDFKEGDAVKIRINDTFKYTGIIMGKAGRKYIVAIDGQSNVLLFIKSYLYYKSHKNI